VAVAGGADTEVEVMVGVGDNVAVKLVVNTAVAVDVEVVSNGFDSSGQGSPGSSMKEELAA
jgi:hypothetical protein